MHRFPLCHAIRLGLIGVTLLFSAGIPIALAQQENPPQRADSNDSADVPPSPASLDKATSEASDNGVEDIEESSTDKEAEKENGANESAGTETDADANNDPKEAVDTETDADENSDSPDASDSANDGVSVNESDEASDPQDTSDDDLIQPAFFNGIQPGTTTHDELLKKWGQPATSSLLGDRLTLKYTIAPFRNVSVSIIGDDVHSIVVELPQPTSPDELARQLKLARFVPAKVTNEFGVPLGLAFPERGVLFAITEHQSVFKVAQVILETIDPNTFVMRAEKNSDQRIASSLSDFNHAIELNPSVARPYWRKAQVLLKLGRLEEAQKADLEAIRLEPENPRFRLTHARILDHLGEHEQAVAEAGAVVKNAGGDLILEAEALAQLGDLLANGPNRDDKLATNYHTSAAKIAQNLWDSRQIEVRTRARKLTIDMHLAVARDVARGHWNSKRDVVPLWLDRAREFAIKDAGKGELSAAARFNIGRSTLDAYTGSQGIFDPTDVIDEVLVVGRELIEATDEKIDRQLVEWQLGLALYDAVRTYEIRGQFAQALEKGALALEYFKRCEDFGRQQSGYAHLVGNIYYRIGSIHAEQNKDHTEAVRWLEKAVPLIAEAVSETVDVETGHHGETLVSIAISLWNVGRKQEALDLTILGIELIELAVEEELLAEASLSAPYANLASMHRDLGNEENADRYEEMATQIEATKTRR